MQKKFINRLHLVLHACVKIFDMIFFAFTGFMRWELNMSLGGGSSMGPGRPMQVASVEMHACVHPGPLVGSSSLQHIQSDRRWMALGVHKGLYLAWLISAS